MRTTTRRYFVTWQSRSLSEVVPTEAEALLRVSRFWASRDRVRAPAHESGSGRDTGRPRASVRAEILVHGEDVEAARELSARELADARPARAPDSVVGLGVETPDGFNFTGIAYFVSVPATLVPGKVHVYLVTAGHSVRDRDNLVARLNAPGGGTIVDLLPLSDRWLRLTDPAAGEHHVDLAAVRWNPQASAEAGYRPIPLAMLFDERLVGNDAQAGVGIGDEVFAIGLTSVRYAQEQNAPVIRTGHIAMILSEPMLVRFGRAGPSSGRGST